MIRDYPKVKGPANVKAISQKKYDTPRPCRRCHKDFLPWAPDKIFLCQPCAAIPRLERRRESLRLWRDRHRGLAPKLLPRKRSKGNKTDRFVADLQGGKLRTGQVLQESIKMKIEEFGPKWMKGPAAKEWLRSVGMTI